MALQAIGCPASPSAGNAGRLSAIGAQQAWHLVLPLRAALRGAGEDSGTAAGWPLGLGLPSAWPNTVLKLGANSGAAGGHEMDRLAGLASGERARACLGEM